MALLLHIDTATEHASVCVSDNEKVLHLLQSTEQKNHASFVQPAIEELMIHTGNQLTDIAAVSVTAGPGSYTGLRVGMASAKGICFALDKPLILIDTLTVMAQAVLTSSPVKASDLICPMIDARRMEVFTAVFDHALRKIMPPQAMILDEHAFGDLLAGHHLVFAGNGHVKFKNLLRHTHASFSEITHDASHLALLAANAFINKEFADLAYSEPFYLKEFFSPAGRSQGR